jgi:hypothetical protein
VLLNEQLVQRSLLLGAAFEYEQHAVHRQTSWRSTSINLWRGLRVHVAVQDGSFLLIY